MTRNHVKEFTALFVSVLLLSACGDAASSKSTQDTQTTDNSSAETDAETEAETNALEALQAEDFGGASFVILGDTYSNWWTISLEAQEENGEVINDTVYRRNRYIEDLYNVTISLEETNGSSGAAASSIKKSVAAGSDDYQMVWECINCLLSVAEGGYLSDIRDYPEFDLNASWWDQDAIDAFTINGKTFFAANDINIHTMEGCSALYFSKTLASVNDLENPYDLVREKKWTLDKMFEMMKTVSADTNGDGKRDAGDTFGLVTGIGQYLSMVNGAGAQLVYLDNSSGSSKFILNTASEDLIAVTSVVADMLNDKQLTVIVNNDDWGYDSFYADQALFYIMQLGSIGELRDMMETDFGVLPFPLRDESQESYTTSIEATAQAVCFPVTVSDKHMVGTITEGMAIYSDLYLIDAFYETTLKGKIARDSDTTEMLDILVSNRTYDYSTCYGSWGVYTKFLSEVQKHGSETLVSMTAQIQSKFDEKSQASLDALSAIE